MSKRDLMSNNRMFKKSLQTTKGVMFETKAKNI